MKNLEQVLTEQRHSTPPRGRPYSTVRAFFARYLRHPVIGYCGALLFSAVAIAITLLLVHNLVTFAYPGSISILAILLIALLWGAGPSLMATLLLALLLNLVILPPQFKWSLQTIYQLIDTGMFLLIGIVISVVASQIERARSQAVIAWKHLHELFMQAPTNIAVMRGPDFRFELANPPYLETAGRSNVLGKAVREVYPEAEQEQFMQLLAQVYKTGVPYVGRETWAQMRTPESNTLREGYYNFVVQPFRDSNEQVEGIIVHGVDVTEQVRARQRIEDLVRQLEAEKEALHRVERRTHDALTALLAMAEVLVEAPPEENLPEDDIAIETKRITYRLAQLTQRVLACERVSIVRLESETKQLRPLAVVGYQPDEEQQWSAAIAELQLRDGLSLEEIARLNAGQVVIHRVSQSLKNHGLPSMELAEVLVAPLKIGPQLTGLLMIDYGNTTHAYIAEEKTLAGGVARLVSLVIERERLLQEQALARAKELALTESTQRMNTFLGIASHEMKTPLTVIKGNLQLVDWNVKRIKNHRRAWIDDADNSLATLSNMIAQSAQQVDRLTRLINDLVEVTRLQTNNLMMNMKECDLAAIVREMVAEQRVLASTRVISLELPSTLSIPVYADAGRIGQVVTNYLTNALKYSAEDQPVEVWIEVRDQNAYVFVRDRGPGIAVEQQARIWERFHRVDGIKVQSGPGIGLGLGLYISHMIIESHAGQVGVESMPGEGSTFWFTLPLQNTARNES